ncbi:MAG: hypothetical protein KAR06_02685 [Deltaproteobacteria bacterium]|nr:hypothetical protein [Deltaproteobacteria bacterium]
MALTPQQKQILQFMAGQSAARPFKEMAKESGIAAPSFRSQLSKLREENLVEATDEDNLIWVITDAGMELIKSGEADLSRQDVGLTERQIFEQKARAIGGIPAEKLTVITDMVWSRDPHKLEEVWHALNETNLPIDIRRMLFSSWRSYLRQQGMPVELPESIKEAVETAPGGQAKEKPKKDGESLDYFIQNGEIIRGPHGSGDFTLADAKEILALEALKLRFTPGATGAQATVPDSISSLINALTPLLKSETDQGILKELLESKISIMTQELKGLIPIQKEEKTFFQQLSELKEIGPLLKSIFGIPEQAAQQAGAQVQPIQLQTPDGQPVVIDLSTFFTMEKFKREQKREDAADERRDAMSKTFRTLMDKLGNAAGRVASGE